MLLRICDSEANQKKENQLLLWAYKELNTFPRSSALILIKTEAANAQTHIHPLLPPHGALGRTQGFPIKAFVSCIVKT